MSSMDDLLTGSRPAKSGCLRPVSGALRVAKAKIVDYLLNLNSKDGGSKMKFFPTRGFSVEDWSILADALRDHAGNKPIASIW